MEIRVNSSAAANRYVDGVKSDYETMIRLWSAFDRSLKSFNRRCGVVIKTSSATGQNSFEMKTNTRPK